MNLPVRLLAGPPTEPSIFVDGFEPSEQARLVLSHWPGNTTPDDLRHELSTGSCLAFARLDASERERRSAGATAIVNNHYDTDGVLALFAVRHPDRALPRAERMLAAAAAGDFEQSTTEHALALDTLIARLVEPGVSPLPLEGQDELARQQTAVEFLMEELPSMLDGDLESYRDLWLDRVESVREDEALLSMADRVDVRDAYLTAWTLACPVGIEVIDPMRQALFGASDSDRVAILGSSSQGTSCRVLFSTRSWFDLPDVKPLPRPDLEQITAELDAACGTAGSQARAWRSRPGPGAELWFGGRSGHAFADRARVLAPAPLQAAELLQLLVSEFGGSAPARTG